LLKAHFTVEIAAQAEKLNNEMRCALDVLYASFWR